MNEKLQEQLADIFTQRYKDFNDKILEELGKTINKFAKLTPTQAHKLAVQLKYNKSYKELIKELAKVAKMSQKDIKKILEEVAKQNIEFADTFYKARGLKTPIYEDSKSLQRLVNAYATISSGNMFNLAKTTGFRLLDNKKNPLLLNFEKTYIEVIDRCVYATMTGTNTFGEVMKNTISQLVDSGVRNIEYRSGYTQRLDSAVRRNVLDTMRELNNEVQVQFGEEFEADGVEISTHENPAPDHEDVQGRQFAKEEFNKFQEQKRCEDTNGNVYNDITDIQRRAISTLNCYHYVFSIILGVSKPLKSNAQLEAIKKRNESGVKIDDKDYTMYQVTQIQRKIETEIRKEKDNIAINRFIDTEQAKQEVINSNKRIKLLRAKYNEICKISGLSNRLKTKARVYR